MTDSPDGVAPSAIHSNPVTAQGFAMLPMAVMTRHDLSLGARIVYGYLKHMAWRGQGSAESAQTEIGSALGISERAVRDYLKELRDAGLVESKRRGLGLSNLYVVHDPQPEADSAVQNGKDRRSDRQTPPVPRERDRAGKAEEVQEVQEARTPNGVLATRDDDPAAFDPTKITLVEGRNLGFDALADECGINPKSPRVGEIATALNGRPRHPELGIRSLLYGELCDWAIQNHTTLLSVPAALATEPERFEQALAMAIHEKAAKYRVCMDGAILTPTALAKWWLDLDRMEDSRGGLSVEGMLNLDA